MADLHHSLWNSEVDPDSYTPANTPYLGVLFEQYKLCVETADRVSARRGAANTFFLSLNSAIATAMVGGLGPRPGRVSVWLLLAGLLILVGQCVAWYLMVRSYRQLNTAKWAVIGAFENRLPAYAYSRAEWTELGEGEDWRRYVPLTRLEQWVPPLFVAAYLVGFLALASAP
ncbi:RipA family octameric membrane protein [Streptomyces sp. DSM 40750]|uniref:RipA family octameric membrane protein n=1 Tax=Streptomyces sp. DSM 40750 TaxID=2801030 RepID=UPI00214C910E|nr:hypothetical protein [Streptomyces sp. DSM 40750]UUU23068.1 hypothetical protein JIX55_23780 [Streptomyces sp. DSM 40750]